MCGGVTFEYQGEDFRIYFPNPNAVLPVRLKSGAHELIPWGRRREQQGLLPVGGWARLDSIYAGRWDKWFPVPVKIDLTSFMEKDYEGKSHWFDLMKGQYIQGLIARDKGEQRVYVVTIPPEPELADIHDRWPRVMMGG